MNAIYKITAAAAALCLVPTSASAQFGGLGKLLGQGAGGQSVSGDEANQFLDKALRSTKNVMIAAAVISQSVSDAKNLTARKSYIDAVSNAQDIKELDAYRTEFQSDINVMNGTADLASTLQAAQKTATAKQREQIGIAVVNLAIGIARNIELAGTAPKVVGAIGHNPALLTRVGQFKTAASLVGLQAKGLSGVATTVPKLIGATKVKMPADAKGTEPKPVLL